MRYLPHGEATRRAMLDAIGVDSVDSFFSDVPESARSGVEFRLPTHRSEMEVEGRLRALSSRNVSAGSGPFFIGAGAYRHHVPATADHLIQRSEFLTSYTPYQPEIAQGTLTYLFEFQTQVSELFGMEVANASMYDGASACAEAALMAMRATKRSKALMSGRLHPHYRETTRSLVSLEGASAEGIEPDLDADRFDAEALLERLDDDVACVIVQNPDVFGGVHDLSEFAEAVHARGAWMIVAVTEVVSLGAIRSPGEMGADVVVGEGQSLGVGLQFGGPSLGLFAARARHARLMPGRLCGETVDVDGRRGFVLTLSAREQHIRREKATSNICTNSGLCCLAFTIHMTLLGGEGLSRLAELNHRKASRLAALLGEIDGVEMMTSRFFNEFAYRTPRRGSDVVSALARRGILGGAAWSRLGGETGASDPILAACTETASDDDMIAYRDALADVLKEGA